MVASVIPGGPRQQMQVNVASATALPIPRMRPTANDTVATAAPMPLPNPAPAADADPAPQATASIAATPAAPAPARLPINDTTTVASLIGANSPLALQAADETPAAETPAAQAADAQATNGPAQVADATPANGDDATGQGDTGGNDESVDAKPADAHTGWRIQIAAAPTQAGAEDMLDRALARGGKVLAHASPYTEAVKAGAGTAYRARFAGFTSKEAARAACAFLVKQKFSCLAVGNN
jgi:D-alanyl-D-alanine carboxypeptidase